MTDEQEKAKVVKFDYFSLKSGELTIYLAYLTIGKGDREFTFRYNSHDKTVCHVRSGALVTSSIPASIRGHFSIWVDYLLDYVDRNADYLLPDKKVKPNDIKPTLISSIRRFIFRHCFCFKQSKH